MTQSQSLVPGWALAIIYWAGLLTVLSIGFTIDYVLIHLWIYGSAQLGIVIMVLVASSVLLFDALSIVSTISFFRGLVRNRSGGHGGSSALLYIYMVIVIVAIVYYTYFVLQNNASIYIEAYGQGVIGNRYIGYGIALYNLGLALLMLLILKFRGFTKNIQLPIVNVPGLASQLTGQGRRRGGSDQPVIEIYDENGRKIDEIYVT